jgi:hypothetical protein
MPRAIDGTPARTIGKRSSTCQGLPGRRGSNHKAANDAVAKSLMFDIPRSPR